MDLPSFSDMIVLRITDKQRLWVSGAADDVWKDSTPFITVHTPSIMRCSISQESMSLSHLDETSTVGMAASENASDGYEAK
jgi:hypothetical protein